MMEDESSQSEKEKQLALKSLLFCDGGEEHRVQHDDDSKIKQGENEASTNSTSDQEKTLSGNSPLRLSPDPNCAICLGTLENKSFTDSCFHTFCFTCLVKWSKVKAECPLCKQPFKSIVHNVRSIEDYDQYYISSKSTDTSWGAPEGRSFRYRSTMTSERWTGRHGYGTFEDSIEYRAHRMIYAPHSVSFPTVRTLISECPSTSSYRRHIYENGLWVKPLGDGNTQRYRITSPEFFRQNPACTHRLTPWLNRELLALLYDSESQVTFVLELILALIMRYDIRSEEFYVHIEPYLQHRTSHFIHEFFNFASSSHADMRTYDSCASYEKLETISESSDVVPIATPSITISENSPPWNVVQNFNCSSNLSKRKHTKSSKRQPKLFLRRNQESNVWHSFLPPTSQSLRSTSSGDSSDYALTSGLLEFLDVVSGPSTSGLQVTATESKKMAGRCFPNTNLTSGSSSDTDDECIVVDIVKPRTLRTPELVNLVSSSEDERTLEADDVHDYYVMTAEDMESTSFSKRKEHPEEGEDAGVKGSKKKLRHQSKKSINASSTLNQSSYCENLISTVQTPISPPPQDQGISPSSPASACKTYVEHDETNNVNKSVPSLELPLCLDILDSPPPPPPPPVHSRRISCSSSNTECSQNTGESGKTCSTNEDFSEVLYSEEGLPNSISSPPSITLASDKKGDLLSSIICTKQDSDFVLNHKALSLPHNEENTNTYEKWQQNNCSSGSSLEESASFEVSETRGKLRSVICRFPTSDQQNSRSDSSRHSSSRSKRHKHKKKKKKHGKHKHHKHSRSVSD